jgi:hypothetical protein
VAYRDRSDTVKFLEINAPTYRLLTGLQEEGALAGGDLLERIAAEMEIPDSSAVLRYGREALAGLLEKGVLVLESAGEPDAV